MTRPTKPMVCSEPDCGELRPCPKPGHTPKAWAGSTRRASLPANWNQLRARQFHLDQHTCTAPGCDWHDPSGRTLECDHTGDRHDHTQLTTLCGKGSPHDHHGQRTKQQAKARHTRGTR